MVIETLLRETHALIDSKSEETIIIIILWTDKPLKGVVIKPTS